MALTLKFYTDANLTHEITVLTYTRATDGSLAAEDRLIYCGSAASGKTFTAVAGGNITLSITDVDAGSGVPAAAVKIAATQPGLAGAVAGAGMNLGASMSSGIANAKAIWVRVQTDVLAIGDYADLALEFNNLMEV